MPRLPRLASSGADAEIVSATREVGLLVAWPSARMATVVLLVAAATGIHRTRALPSAVAGFAAVVAVTNAVYAGSAPGPYHLWVAVASLTLVVGRRRRVRPDVGIRMDGGHDGGADDRRTT